MSKYYYSIYGINLSSNIELKEFRKQLDKQEENLVVNYNNYSKELDYSKLFYSKLIDIPSVKNFIVRAQILFSEKDYKFVYQYYIEEKVSSTVFTLSKDLKELKVENYNYPSNYEYNSINLLCHPIMAYVARLKKTVCLHANVINIKDQAIAFLGHSGAGKSTISAILSNNGYNVFSDDVCSLKTKNGNFFALNGLKNFRLDEKTALGIFGKSKSFDQIINYEHRVENPKIYVKQAYKASFCQKYLPLKAIYFIGERDESLLEPKITSINYKEALHILLRNTSCKQVLDTSLKKQEFKILVELAKNIPIKILNCPKSLNTVKSEIENSVLNDLNKS